jgi:hypothetical protein
MGCCAGSLRVASPPDLAFAGHCQGGHCQGVVAIDGKVLCRSHDRAHGNSISHMVCAWGREQRMLLAQMANERSSTRSRRCRVQPGITPIRPEMFAATFRIMAAFVGRRTAAVWTDGVWPREAALRRPGVTAYRAAPRTNTACPMRRAAAGTRLARIRLRERRTAPSSGTVRLVLDRWPPRFPSPRGQSPFAR